ncbi:Myomesin-2 [Larimichthys crocea]|uniref:Uncharacterized protein n=1 Tax=Larimichthys crocea TaxID=215358 RepID=A0ACD3QTA9_LARCR|nr:Myomesin-2 [Larimichthys crocea]
MAGVGKPSEASEAFLCEKWTMPEPGEKKNISTVVPYDLELREVSGLQAGQTYRLRVSAVNEAGVGCASLPTEPVTAQTQPGTKNVEIGVDNDGFIFLSYQADKMNDTSEFLWSKNYTEAIDAGRAQAETKKNGSVLTFKDASEEDLGLYTVKMSDNSSPVIQLRLHC